jgi:hypothetical protein
VVSKLLCFLEDKVPKKSRGRPKPEAVLSIEQLEAIANYLGYRLTYSIELYDTRSGNIEARGDRALQQLRSLYLERDLGVLADIPELGRASSHPSESPLSC